MPGGATIQPVFVFDPRFYGADSHACDGRIAFLHECLASLRERYRRHGSELAFLHGNPAVGSQPFSMIRIPSVYGSSILAIRPPATVLSVTTNSKSGSLMRPSPQTDNAIEPVLKQFLRGQSSSTPKSEESTRARGRLNNVRRT